MYRPPPPLRGRCCRRDGFPKRDFHVPGRGAHALQDLLLILYVPPNFLEGLTTALPNLPSRPQVNRLMDLIVNSLYSNKDVRSAVLRLTSARFPIAIVLTTAPAFALNLCLQVFLRELVSNASDALDKIRFIRHGQGSRTTGSATPSRHYVAACRRCARQGCFPHPT